MSQEQKLEIALARLEEKVNAMSWNDALQGNLKGNEDEEELKKVMKITAFICVRDFDGNKEKMNYH